MYLKTEYYKSLLDFLLGCYPTQDQVRTILNSSGIPAGEINLTGSAKIMWDSVLGYAEQRQKLDDLLQIVSEKYAQNVVFKSLHQAFTDQSAFLPQQDYQNFIAGTKNQDAIKILLISDELDTANISGLQNQLKVIALAEKIELKDITKEILAGQDRSEQELAMIGESCIILLFLTPNFFINTTNNCLPLAFAANQMKKVIVPILLEHCAYARINFLKGIQVLPRNNTFILSANNKTKLEYDAAIEIENLANYIKERELCR